MTTRRPFFLSLAALVASLCAAPAASAQSILLSASGFALLGGTAITSTGVVGTTITNGNVGLSPGATTGITGFPPAVIMNGAIIATGGVTAQARLDLITAAVGLAGMPSTANMSTVDLGGKTLAPGVYTFNGAASQNGALVLDAQGHNNVAWVFQIGTALTTSINSTVTFINLGTNGGSDNGVFWNAGSAVNIGANNQLAGNYLAGTSIVFGALSAGGGRALALAGISLDNDRLNVFGGPAGSDYSGGLFYSATGAVVPSYNGAGPLIISPGTLTGGVGVIGNDVVNNGTLSPGLASGVVGPGVTPGTLNVAQNLTQTPSGTLVIHLASLTVFDQVVVTGTAALAGTLQVDVVNGFNPLGHSFPVILAAGGVSGTFGTVNGTAFATNRAAIAAGLTYGPTSVTVSFLQLPFTGFALTPNQAAIATAAQASPDLTVALNTLPLASQFPAAFNTLSPQGYAIWSETAFDHAGDLANRLARADYAVVGRDEYYFQVGERRGRIDGNQDVGSATFTTSAGLVGGNHAVDPTFTIGAFLSFGQTTSGLGSAGSHTTTRYKMPGVRLAWNRDGWFSEASLGYSFDRYTATRVLTFPGTSATTTMATDGHQWFGAISAGRHFTRGAVTISPFVGLIADRWQAEAFTENGGGALNVTVADQSARSLRSQAGVEARFGRGVFQPHVRAAWLHEFSNDARSLDASLGNIDYAVRTRDPKRDTGVFSAGIDFVLGPRALLYTDLSAETGGTAKILSAWHAGLSVNF